LRIVKAAAQRAAGKTGPLPALELAAGRGVVSQYVDRHGKVNIIYSAWKVSSLGLGRHEWRASRAVGSVAACGFLCWQLLGRTAKGKGREHNYGFLRRYHRIKINRIQLEYEIENLRDGIRRPEVQSRFQRRPEMSKQRSVLFYGRARFKVISFVLNTKYRDTMVERTMQPNDNWQRVESPEFIKLLAALLLVLVLPRLVLLLRLLFPRLMILLYSSCFSGSQSCAIDCVCARLRGRQPFPLIL
jgi:hypothetical protein